MARWFSRRMLNQRLSIHSINTAYPLKSKQQAAAEHVVFILESKLAITYSDWRASIRHFKTLCNWCLSADCLWICSTQINTTQLYVCIAVIVMQSGSGKVAETLWCFYISVRGLLCQAMLLWGPIVKLYSCYRTVYVYCIYYVFHPTHDIKMRSGFVHNSRTGYKLSQESSLLWYANMQTRPLYAAFPDIHPKLLELCQNLVVSSWTLIMSAISQQTSVETRKHFILMYICTNIKCLDWNNSHYLHRMFTSLFTMAACYQNQDVHREEIFTWVKFIFACKKSCMICVYLCFPSLNLGWEKKGCYNSGDVTVVQILP